MKLKSPMRNTLLSIIILIFMLALTTQAQDALNHRGLFHIRNQFPVNLQFLSFYAENSAPVEKGTLSISLQYTHSNTFSMYGGSLNQIDPGDTRSEYIPDINRAENDYYFDTATGILNLNFKYGVTKTINIGIDIPLITYQNGFLDEPIETFHNTFGIANFNRAKIALNQSDIYIKSNGEFYYSSCGIGLGDIAINLKTNLFQTDNRNFEISLLSSVKLPTGIYEKFTGSGSFDYGFNLLVTNSWRNHFLTNNLSVVFPGKWKLFPELAIHNFYSWVIGYEYYFNHLWSFIFQHRILSSPLYENDFPSAAKPAFEWTSGIKIDLSHNLQTSFGVTQNYINHENVPDFGFHIGIETTF